jgi:hypothetical protein
MSSSLFQLITFIGLIVSLEACPAWELAAGTYLFKLQRLQINVLLTIGNFPRCTPVRDFHMAFNLPYLYDYITKLCREQADVIQNYENEHVRSVEQGEAGIKIVRGLNFGVAKLTTVEVIKLPLYHNVRKLAMTCFAKPILTEDLYID